MKPEEKRKEPKARNKVPDSTWVKTHGKETIRNRNSKKPDDRWLTLSEMRHVLYTVEIL